MAAWAVNRRFQGSSADQGNRCWCERYPNGQLIRRRPPLSNNNDCIVCDALTVIVRFRVRRRGFGYRHFRDYTCVAFRPRPVTTSYLNLVRFIVHACRWGAVSFY